MSKTTSLLTRRRLDEVAESPVIIAQLQRHAERRLARVRRSLPEGALQQLDGEDLVKEALVEAFVGTLSHERGRHPRKRHLTSGPEFTRWLQSVLNSLAANLRASAAARARRIKLEGAFELVCPAPNACEVADFRLRMAALLTELRREFAHRPVILALLRDWERDSAHLDRLKAASSGDAGLNAQSDDFASTTAFLGWLRHCIQRHLVPELGQQPLSAPQLRREFAGQPEVLAVLNAWDAPLKTPGQHCAQPIENQPPQRSPTGSESPPHFDFAMKNSSSKPPTSLLVYSYTRSKAIADGVLFDVTPLAKEAGFRHPVALTADLWAAYGEPHTTPAEDRGTAWDIIWMLRCAAVGILPARVERYPLREITHFELWLTPRGQTQPELVRLKAICDGDDDGAPVITVLLPHED